jgi:hypothetical protein
MDVVCEMSLYRSFSHYLARRLSPERLATLSPTERTARTRAQKRLSNAKRRAKGTQSQKPLFIYPDVQPPPRMDSWRDYLFRDPSHRDIIRP